MLWPTLLEDAISKGAPIEAVLSVVASAARTEINSFQVYNFNVRAQIGPVMSKMTGQTL